MRSFSLHGEARQRSAIRMLSWLGAPALNTLAETCAGDQLGVRTPGGPGLARSVRPPLRDVSGGIRVNALAAAAELRPRWLKAKLRRALTDAKTYVRPLAALRLGDS